MQVVDAQSTPPNLPMRQALGIPSTATSTGSDSKSYTILRIKRKRNEEPLDALGQNNLTWRSWSSSYNPQLLNRESGGKSLEVV